MHIETRELDLTYLKKVKASQEGLYYFLYTLPDVSLTGICLYPATDLITHLLATKPKDRPTMAEVPTCPWFKGYVPALTHAEDEYDANMKTPRRGERKRSHALAMVPEEEEGGAVLPDVEMAPSTPLRKRRLK